VAGSSAVDWLETVKLIHCVLSGEL